MSCIRKIKSFNIVKDVKVKYANKQELDKLISNIKEILIQKLSKLNILIKNMDISVKDNSLIVNDQYGICDQLPDIAKSFGFKVKQLDKQKYQIKDELLDLLNQIDEPFDLSSIFNNINVLKSDQVVKTDKVISIIKDIRTNGTYTYKQTKKVNHVYYDDIEQYFEQIDSIKRDKDKVLSLITKYLNNLNDKIKQANNQLAAGTVALIKYRAKQLGYSVKQTNNSDNVQLVLERID